MTADEKLLPDVFFVWSLQSDLLAAPGAATVVEAELQAAPRGCGTRQGVWDCTASLSGSNLEVCPSTQGGEKMRWDLRAALSMAQGRWTPASLKHSVPGRGAPSEGLTSAHRDGGLSGPAPHHGANDVC